MCLHVYAQADELNALGTQSHALLETAFAGKKDFPFRSDDAMPRKPIRRSVQRPSDLTGCAGISGGVRNLSISRDLAAGNTAHLREEIGEHRARGGHRGRNDYMQSAFSSHQSAFGIRT